MELREALESAISASEAKESSIAEAPAVETAPAVAAEPVETEAQRTERLRDEKGRFVEGKAEPKEAAPEPVLAPEVKPRPAKPTSWKKDYAEHWEKLDPAVAEYINQREGEYAKGVSTYKQEWDNAKPLIDAVAPLMPLLQQHGIKPDQWIAQMGHAHRTLALGSAQDKLNAFARLAQDYGVPLQALYDPQVAQQFVSQQIQQPQRQAPQADIGSLVKQELAAARLQDSIEQFEAATNAGGEKLYPHFEMVKSDMALLLEAGKAQDLKSAYTMSLRLHDDLWQSEQDAKRKADEASRLEATRKATAAAKASAVSVKSATPATTGAAQPKGRREALLDAWDQHTAGRV